MGCFDATCAVSRTAIGCGDRVLAIWTEVKHIRGTYDLVSEVWHRRQGEKDDSAEQLRKLAEKHPDDLSLGKLAASLTKLDELRHCRVHWCWGTYDDYGGVNEFETPGLVCLVHRRVAEDLVKIGGYKSDELDGDPLMRFLGACSAARIQLFGHELLGVQHGDLAEARFIMRVGSAASRQQRRMLRENWMEAVRWWFDDLRWRVGWRRS